MSGQQLEGADRDEAEAKVEDLRTELNVPEGVTAQQVATDEQTKQASTTTTTTTTGCPGEGAASTHTTTTTTPPLNQYGVNTNDEKFFELFQLESQLAASATPADQQTPEGEVTLPDEDGVLYTLGPVALTGTAGRGRHRWPVRRR